MNLTFRKTLSADIERIMELVAAAQAWFRSRGIDQWQDGYPSKEVIAEDIAQGRSYVAEQEGRTDSVLQYYRKLIALRKSEDYRSTFTYGEFVPAYEKEEGVFSYFRINKESGQRILVIGNYGKAADSFCCCL